MAPLSSWILLILFSVILLEFYLVCGNPTIVTHSPFDAGTDAAVLRGAMKRVGTDEAQIISIVTKRTLAQRLEIVEAYQKHYNRNLIKDLKKEIGGNLQELVVAMFQSIPEFYAETIHRAVYRYGTEDQVLSDIFCCTNDFTIDDVALAYKKLYNRDLRADVKKDVSGDYAELLEALMKKKRNSSGSFHKNVNGSLKVAKELVKAGVGIWLGTKEKPIINIFSESSYKELAEISKEYQKFIKIPLAESLKSETSGNFRDLLLKILHYAESPINHYALILHSALQHSNISLLKDIHHCRTVIRVLVTRSELDLIEIEERYSVIASKSLEASVKAATSSDFRKACLNIIQGNR